MECKMLEAGLGTVYCETVDLRQKIKGRVSEIPDISDVTLDSGH